MSSPEIGVLIAGVLILCLRAWLLSLCASWLLPGLTLAYWQWVVVVLSFRSLIAPVPSANASSKND
jgi:hypothetical protein